MADEVAPLSRTSPSAASPLAAGSTESSAHNNASSTSELNKVHNQQQQQTQQLTRNERKRRFREEQQAAKLLATAATGSAASSTTIANRNGNGATHKKPLRMPASAYLPLSTAEHAPLVRRCVVAYDGSDFQGFQAQDKPDTMRTVQETIEDALLRTTGETLRVRAASRTDAGVHALGQVVAITSRCIATDSAFRDALNSRLPPDVVCRSLQTLPPATSFDPRACSKRKTYAYRITTGALRPVLDRQREWHVKQQLDVAAMREACQQFVRPAVAKDFCSFTPQQRTAADGSSTDTVCLLTSLDVIERPDVLDDVENQRLEIVVTGDRFLYKMVRNIVGTLVDVGRGRVAPESISDILAAKSRARAGQGAPPHGLTLVHIAYD